MRLLIDAQLPPGLAEFLTTAEIKASAVRDVGLRDSSDAEIWQFASRHQYVLVTKDEDFVHMALGSDSGPQVVWLRLGNSTNPELFNWISPLLPDIFRELDSGQRLVEVV